jgi:hypothetical protein
MTSIFELTKVFVFCFELCKAVTNDFFIVALLKISFSIITKKNIYQTKHFDSELEKYTVDGVDVTTSN